VFKLHAGLNFGHIESEYNSAFVRRKFNLQDVDCFGRTMKGIGKQEVRCCLKNATSVNRFYLRFPEYCVTEEIRTPARIERAAVTTAKDQWKYRVNPNSLHDIQKIRHLE